MSYNDITRRYSFGDQVEH